MHTDSIRDETAMITLSPVAGREHRDNLFPNAYDTLQVYRLTRYSGKGETKQIKMKYFAAKAEEKTTKKDSGKKKRLRTLLLPEESLRKRMIRWTVYLILLWLFSTAALVLMFRVVDPPVWAWRVHRAVAPPAESVRKVRHVWVDREAIAPAMQLAVIAAEDQLFPQHNGFDWNAIEAALDDNAEGKRIRGASTISQQTAKNLFLWPARSWLRKGVEAYFTVLLEVLWPKSRILEVYLNLIEFGPGIYGVEAAGRHYFGKPAANLTADQAARLAAVLPNPYQYQVKPPSAYVTRRSEWIQQQMRQLGTGTLEAVEAE